MSTWSRSGVRAVLLCLAVAGLPSLALTQPVIGPPLAPTKVVAAPNPTLDPKLLQAIADEKVDEVKKLLKKGACPNALEGTDAKSKASALFKASSKGNIEIMRLLLEAGADPNSPGAYDVEAISIAAINDHPEAVETLIKAGADVNATAKGGNNAITPLMYAAAGGRTEIVKMLLAAGAQVNALSSDHANALMFGAGKTAYNSGNLETERLLVEAGCNAWQVSDNKEDALAIAKRLEMNDIADFFSSLAQLNEPLLIACNKGDAAKARELLDQNASTAATTGTLTYKTGETERKVTGITSLMVMAGVPVELDVVQRLIDHSNIDVQNSDGETALYTACDQGNTRLITALLTAGANPLLKSKINRTPLSMFIHTINDQEKLHNKIPDATNDTDEARAQTLRALISATAKDKKALDSLDDDYKNALMHAATYGQTEAVKQLIAAGADVKLSNENEMTAAGFAFNNHHYDIVELLTAAGANPPTDEEMEEMIPYFV